MPRPMPADPHAWRHDRLGTRVRAGLATPARRAAPSPEVWRRIASGIEPRRPPRRRRWLAWLGPADADPVPGAGRLCGLLGSGNTAILGAGLVLGLVAFGNLTTLAARQVGPRCLDAASALCVWDEMSPPELAIQPVVQADAVMPPKPHDSLFRVPQIRLVDRVARWRRLSGGREAYNRHEWLVPPPLPSNGTVAVPPLAVALH